MKITQQPYNTRQTSNIQNMALHVGQGHLHASHVSGLDWSCRLANHRPMQSMHHIGRHRHSRHSDVLSSSVQCRHSLTDDTDIRQPTHCSKTYSAQWKKNMPLKKFWICVLVCWIINEIKTLPSNPLNADLQRVLTQFQWISYTVQTVFCFVASCCLKF